MTRLPALVLVFAFGLSAACAASTPGPSDGPEPSGSAVEAEPSALADPPPEALTSAPAEPSTGSQAKPLASVLKQGIYTPDPDPKALIMTKAARFDQVDGRAVIGFCVTTSGETTDVHVDEPFPGDPQVDQILMDTISTWRFKPFIVDGAPIKTCTQRTFNIRFKPAEPKPAGPKPAGPK